MLILGIETSCDETSCAVLKGRDRVLSNVVSSSLFRQRPFGGIVPEIASRHCLEQIDVVFREAMRAAKVRLSDIRLVAVTQGPGLIGSLLVGVSFAKMLALRLGVPCVGVNHLEAHLETPFLKGKCLGEIPKPLTRPERFVGLLVSGGHTILTWHDGRRVKRMGETVDDAAGEAYDKVAKLMGLGYPGGPVIDRLAREGDPGRVRFTMPKQDHPYDFSFSGIKTAVLYFYQKHAPQCKTARALDQLRRDIAAGFQEAVVDWLVRKTLALAKEKRASDIVVGGGVSANRALREKMTAEAANEGNRAFFPPFSLTGDNAAMIACRGYDLFRAGKRSPLNMAAAASLPLFA
ncbi:MAG: tRNA (adenosine(37)-N6)-threonylcarbamoyltransferase complex transferase subunit TsaD [Candidatus Omnitrophota bacterium]